MGPSEEMAWQALLRYGKSFGTGFVVGLPIYVTISDYGFCVARVDGISMQVGLGLLSLCRLKMAIMLGIMKGPKPCGPI